MNFDPDFRAPNSNDTVVAAAVVAFIIAGLVWVMTEVFGNPTTQAATLPDHLTTKQQSCIRQINEIPPKGCVATQQASAEGTGEAR